MSDPLDITDTLTSGVSNIGDITRIGGGLLRELQSSFRSVPCSLADSDLAVIKTLGAVVIDRNTVSIAGGVQWSELQVASWKTIPNHFFVAIHRSLWEKTWNGIEADDRAEWWFVYGQKQDRLPPGYAATGPGYAYQISVWLAWSGVDDRVNWATYYTIDPTQGRAHPCRERIDECFGQHHRPVWKTHPAWTGENEKAGGVNFACVITWAMNLAPLMDAQWRVSMSTVTDTRKYPSKCHFMLSPDTARKVFKHRDKNPSALTPGGKRRPILHWTRAHHRKRTTEKPPWWHRAINWMLRRTGDNRPAVNVKTHLRGLRDFQYGELQCTVSVPGKHVPVLSESGVTAYLSDKPRPNTSDTDAMIEGSLLSTPAPKCKWYSGKAGFSVTRPGATA